VKRQTLTSSLRGGLEMLFSNQRRHSLSLPAKDASGKPATVAFLIDHLCEMTMRDGRKELFVLDNHLYVSPDRLPCGRPRVAPICPRPLWASSLIVCADGLSMDDDKSRDDASLTYVRALNDALQSPGYPGPHQRR